MKVTLSVEYPAQTIAFTGQRCEPGETIEVDDDLGKSLCKQESKWTVVKASKAKTPNKDGDK